MKRDLIKFVSAMAITALISALALSKVYLITADSIEQRALEIQESARKAIFPKGDLFQLDSIEGIVYEKVYSKSDLIGYLFTAYAPAYSSVISTMAGVDKNFTIKGIVILHQNETPGLGARLEEIQSDKYIWQFYKKDEDAENRRPWFQKQFNGLSAIDLNLNQMTEWKDLSDSEKEKFKQNNTVSALSGATISAEAVKKSIKDAAEVLKQALYEKDSSLNMFEESEHDGISHSSTDSLDMPLNTIEESEQDGAYPLGGIN